MKSKKAHLVYQQQPATICQADKVIDNTPKTKFTSTQHRTSHFKPELLIPPKVSTPVLVKAPQQK